MNLCGLHRRISFFSLAFGFALILLGVTLPARAQDDDGAMLKQAEDLVHQAWNPAGDPPSDEQRTQMLTKAIELAQKAPQHHVHRHRMQAIALMKSTLDELKNGDPDKKVSGMLKDADGELREAISESM